MRYAVEHTRQTGDVQCTTRVENVMADALKAHLHHVAPAQRKAYGAAFIAKATALVDDMVDGTVP